MDFEIPAVDAVIICSDEFGKLDVLVFDRFQGTVERAHDKIEGSKGLGFQVIKLFLVLDSDLVVYSLFPGFPPPSDGLACVAFQCGCPSLLPQRIPAVKRL